MFLTSQKTEQEEITNTRDILCIFRLKDCSSYPFLNVGLKSALPLHYVGLHKFGRLTCFFNFCSSFFHILFCCLSSIVYFLFLFLAMFLHFRQGQNHAYYDTWMKTTFDPFSWQPIHTNVAQKYLLDVKIFCKSSLSTFRRNM